MKDSSGDREVFAQAYIDNLCRVLQGLPFNNLAKVLEILEKAFVEGRHIFLAGNGGSAATASHMANDLLKGVTKNGESGLRAIALSDNVSLVTAIANDESFSEIFARQLKVLGQAGDVLVVFSGSGNSANIVSVVETAKRLHLITIGFLGMGGGQVGKIVDVSVIVPSNEYGPVEDVHMVFDHLVTSYLSYRCQQRKQENE